MKRSLLIIIATAVVFAAGVGAGVWLQAQRPVPPPPSALMAELGKGGAPRPTVSDVRRSGDINRPKLISEIERVRPQIAVYRAKVDEIDAAFERDLAGILTPAQLEKYNSLQKGRAERRVKKGIELPEGPVLTSDQIKELQQQPLYAMMGMIVPSMKIDWLTRDLKLDEAQQGKLRTVLLARREKFLALVDQTTPPSLLLSRLAPVTQRLVEPEKIPAEGEKVILPVDKPSPAPAK